MRMINDYTRHVLALEQLQQNKDDPKNEEFIKHLFNGALEKDSVMPTFVGNREASMAMFDDLQSFVDAAKRFFELKAKLNECLKLSNPLAMDYRNYPDFAKFHLMIQAVYAEMSRHNIVFN